MCTLTYIPQGKDTFILTQSRDENIKRAIASPPVVRKINGVNHIFPVDPDSMGTWIGISENGRAACLLNGGSIKHTPKSSYRQSRGLVIMDFFKHPDFFDFYENYSFSGLEPFTMLVFEDNMVFEIVLDEDMISFRRLESEKPFIYSSTTLYTSESIEERKFRFMDWSFFNVNINQPMILDFHKKFLYENETDKNFLDEGEIVKTVSITSLVKTPRTTLVDYYDLLNDLHLWKSMKLVSGVSQDYS